MAVLLKAVALSPMIWFFRWFSGIIFADPPEAAGCVWGKQITICNIPVVNGEMNAIRKTKPAVQLAGRKAVVVMEKTAAPDEPAASPAAPA